MAVEYQEYRGQVLDWFETDFKETAKSTTRTQRLEDGKVSYKFSVVNNSGLDFDRFSFKVRILNKANGQEIGTATIRTGEWKAGETKNFRSKIDIPADVRSISFVMFSESVDYEGRPAGRSSTLTDFGEMIDGGTGEVSEVLRDLKGLGEMVTGADGSGGVLGELFGTGGMPETTVTQTTTTRTPSGTTTTRTTTTTSSGGRVRKETKTTRQTAGQAQRAAQNRQREAQARRNTQSRSSQGNVSRSFNARRTEKKLNKIRLGKSPETVISAAAAAVFAMAAMGAAGDPAQMISYGLVAAVLAGIAAGFKFFKARRGKLVRAYESKINYRGNTSLDDLAAFVGKPVNKVADDLQKMIVEGFFPEAYIDINNRLLVMTKNGEPLENPEKTAAAHKVAKRKAAREKGLVPESIDDLITMTDDAEIKAKLRSLRTITRKIDQRIEERPELEDQVKDFREKYYPEVVRLTDEYNEKIADLGKYSDEKVTEDPLEINANPNYLEEQAAEIKTQLISLIDSVAEASENLLEKLHEDDIMDISTDIKMLQTTLASKGLLDSDFDL